MSMKAGRVGVSRNSVDELGNVKSGGLTPEQRTKLDKALVTPITKPTEKEIVAVGTGNEQIMIKIGSGLKITGETSPFTLESEQTGGLGGFTVKDFIASDIIALPGRKLNNSNQATIQEDASGTLYYIDVGDIPVGVVPKIVNVKFSPDAATSTFRIGFANSLDVGTNISMGNNTALTNVCTIFSPTGFGNYKYLVIFSVDNANYTRISNMDVLYA